MLLHYISIISWHILHLQYSSYLVWGYFVKTIIASILAQIEAYLLFILVQIYFVKTKYVKSHHKQTDVETLVYIFKYMVPMVLGHFPPRDIPPPPPDNSPLDISPLDISPCQFTPPPPPQGQFPPYQKCFLWYGGFKGVMSRGKCPRTLKNIWALISSIS